MFWMIYYDNICDIFGSFQYFLFVFFFLKKIVVIFTRKRKFSNWIFGLQWNSHFTPNLHDSHPTALALIILILIDDSQSHSAWVTWPRWQ